MAARATRPSLLATRGTLAFEPGFVQLNRKKTMIGNAEALPLTAAGGKTGTVATGMNLITVMVGAGVLGLPKTFGNSGWYLGTVVVIFAGLASLEVGVSMASALGMVEERIKAGAVFSFSRPEQYEDLLEASYGRSGRRVASVVLNLFLLMLTGSFMILIGGSLEFLTGALLPYRGWVLASSAVFVPLCLLRDMSVISSLSAVGVVASLLYVVSIVYAGLETAYGTPYGTGGRTFKVVPEKPFQVGSAISLLLLGYGYQMVVPTVRSEMEEPQEMPTAIKTSVGMVMAVYSTVSLVGYYGWGDGVHGNVLASMVNPDGSSMYAGKLLAVAVVANLLVSFPIILNVVASAAEGGTYSPPKRLCLLAVVLALGLFCPFFLEVLNLVASTLGTLCVVFLPLASYWKLTVDCGKRPSIMVCVGHIVILAMGVIGIVFGTHASVLELLEAFERPGANPITNFWRPMY